MESPAELLILLRLRLALHEKQPTWTRHEVRAEFERRFTAGRMAADYLSAYHLLLNRAAATNQFMVEFPLTYSPASELLPKA